MNAPKRLYRSRNQKMIWGICGGIAEYLNVDPTVVRLLFVLAAIVWGGGVLAYLVLYFVMPEAPPINEPEVGQGG
ncbi:PspC domain-containing protein [Meiothermus sp.]|uniref:PspC domain-containing protein n=1 Tax=Meiothermus sp. TaxID=1955249 RepID=UPI00307EA482